MTTKEITHLAAETCAYMAIVHPDYTKLANRMTVQALHARTHDCIKDVSTLLYRFVDKVGRPAPLLSEKVFNIMQEHYERINSELDYSRDFEYDFFGFKTLEKSYLLRVNGEVAERP